MRLLGEVPHIDFGVMQSDTTRRAGGIVKAPRGGYVKIPPDSFALGAFLPMLGA